MTPFRPVPSLKGDMLEALKDIQGNVAATWQMHPDVFKHITAARSVGDYVPSTDILLGCSVQIDEEFPKETLHLKSDTKIYRIQTQRYTLAA